MWKAPQNTGKRKTQLKELSFGCYRLWKQNTASLGCSKLPNFDKLVLLHSGENLGYWIEWKCGTAVLYLTTFNKNKPNAHVCIDIQRWWSSTADHIPKMKTKVRIVSKRTYVWGRTEKENTGNVQRYKPTEKLHDVSIWELMVARGRSFL